LDIDALQQRVDTGAYMQNTAINTTLPEPEPVSANRQPLPLASQLGEGVQKALANGEEQYTVKLNPEELGEVTIRLTRTAEGMRLDIVAQSAETQRLLAAEVDVLREAMKPLKVDVENIFTQQQDAMLNSARDQRGQSRNNGFMRGAAYYGDEPLGQAAEAAAGQNARVTLSGMLNAYV
jgi:flagellar hook-length control protein FliK